MRSPSFLEMLIKNVLKKHFVKKIKSWSAGYTTSYNFKTNTNTKLKPREYYQIYSIIKLLQWLSRKEGDVRQYFTYLLSNIRIESEQTKWIFSSLGVATAHYINWFHQNYTHIILYYYHCVSRKPFAYDYLHIGTSIQTSWRKYFNVSLKY